MLNQTLLHQMLFVFLVTFVLSQKLFFFLLELFSEQRLLLTESLYLSHFEKTFEATESMQENWFVQPTSFRGFFEVLFRLI